LLESTGRSLSLSTPTERARKEIPATLDRPSIHDQLIPSRPKRQTSKLRLEKREEVIIHSQPGFLISKSNDKLKTRIDLDEMNSRPKSQSKSRMLEDEINRLGMLLKAEQHAHEQTKINAQAELDRYREQLEQEKDMTVKGVIDEYMKLNLEQRDSMNREQMEINSGSSSEIRRLENELKDTQVAFDLFQANCRDEFEAKLSQTRAEMQVQRAKEIKECNDRAAVRLKSRLAEQRAELETDFNDSLLKIENQQKQEMEAMMAKLNSSNDDLAQMRETEAKASSLTTRVERQTLRISELEKQNKDYEKKSELLKNKIKQWEQNSKFAIENALAKQAAENEKLMNEIAQLRLRLVSKAETIGAMQFNNSNRITSMGGDVTCARQSKPVTSQVHSKRSAGGLNGILNIKQLDETN